jgi:two-component system, cell cycle response regulator
MVDDDEDGTRTIDLNNLLDKEEQKSGYLMILSSAAPAVMGKLFKVDGKQTDIGRSRDCEVCIEDESVSRRHARLIRAGEDYLLEDLGSANGTFVNGIRVPKATLRAGDKVQVGSTTVLMFSLHDRLEEQFQNRVYEAATLDGLTEVFNRRYLEDVLEKEYAFCSRHEVPLSVVMVDVDRFKLINDTHGHLAGDYVLWQVARLLVSVVRIEDMVGRYGGEEFTLVLRETDRAGALVCAERCRSVIQMNRFRHNDTAIPVTISAGVSTITRAVAGKSARDLVAAADKGLYRAKETGRNRVEFEPVES